VDAASLPTSSIFATGGMTARHTTAGGAQRGGNRGPPRSCEVVARALHRLAKHSAAYPFVKRGADCEPPSTDHRCDVHSPAKELGAKASPSAFLKR